MLDNICHLLFAATIGKIRITGRTSWACSSSRAGSTCRAGGARWAGGSCSRGAGRASHTSRARCTGGSGRTGRASGSSGASDPLRNDKIEDMFWPARDIAHLRISAGRRGNGAADDNGIRRAISRRAGWAGRAGRTRNETRLTNRLVGITGTRTAAVAIVNMQNEDLLAIASGKGFPTASICRAAFGCADEFDTGCLV